MSNPIMMVRKIKNATNNKLERLSEGILKGKIGASEDLSVNLAKTFVVSQNFNLTKKSRSSSILKQKIVRVISHNPTPVNRKLRNHSYFVENTTEMTETSTNEKNNFPAECQTSNIKTIEKWLNDHTGLLSTKNKLSVYLESLRKISDFDKNFKNLIETICNGIENCFDSKNDFSKTLDIKSQENLKIEQLSNQIQELKNTINDLNREKSNVKMLCHL